VPCIHTAGSFFVCLSVVCPAGYCQITCGRCSCCPTLLQAAESAGLTEFAWAMNRSTSNVESLAQPGLIATVMAPDDNAMRTLFDKLGEHFLVVPSVLVAIGSFSILHVSHVSPQRVQHPCGWQLLAPSNQVHHCVFSKVSITALLDSRAGHPGRQNIPSWPGPLPSRQTERHWALLCRVTLEPAFARSA
jgi:hypothetical protein